MLSILLVPLFGVPLFSSEQTGWLASSSFSSLHPTDSGVLVTFDDTLVFNECIMEWVNIPSNGIWGLSNAITWANGARSKDSFSLRFLEFVVRLSGGHHHWLSKGVGWL